MPRGLKPSVYVAGAKFKMLTILERCHKNMVKVRCDCGVEKIVSSSNVKRIVSCGCYLSQVRYENIAKGRLVLQNRARSHNNDPHHQIWRGMIRRCEERKHQAFKNYGERGIQVCEQWKNSLAQFIKDMGPRPTPRHTIDRIDTNGNYEPGNCRWATIKEQQRNKRTNVRLTFDGMTLCVAEWSERLGIKAAKIEQRLRKGWSIDKILTP